MSVRKKDEEEEPPRAEPRCERCRAVLFLGEWDVCDNCRDEERTRDWLNKLK